MSDTEHTFLINQACHECGELREEEFSREEFLLALDPAATIPEQHDRIRLLKAWCYEPLCTECLEAKE